MAEQEITAIEFTQKELKGVRNMPRIKVEIPKSWDRFWDYLKTVHLMSADDFSRCNEFQKQALIFEFNETYK